MAKTVATIQMQIDKLQAQLDAVRAKEAVGVVKRIKEAIAHYKLSPEDLFGSDPTVARVARKRSEGKPVKKGAKAPVKKASAKPIKYADAQGHTWVGHGKRPMWFVAAIEAGATPEDLLVGGEGKP